MYKKINEINRKMIKQAKGDEVFVITESETKCSLRFLPPSTYFVKNINKNNTEFFEDYEKAFDYLNMQ